MGFKGYRLWVMGQLGSNVQSPNLAEGNPVPFRRGCVVVPQRRELRAVIPPRSKRGGGEGGGGGV
jgi:hypothetical protein